ncbi:MAG: redoxin domain-containing protein [Saprospiraceae bacterium]|nr:redoxin domain-containing protein [Saprospiraceae bacterium]
MRWILLVFVFSCLSWTPKKDPVQVDIQLEGCTTQTEMYLYEFTGVNFTKLETVAISDGTAAFEIPQSDPRFYYIGIAEDKVRPLIIGQEPKIDLKANCASFRSATIEGSELNTQYDQLKVVLNAFKTQSNTLSNQFNTSRQDPAAQERILAQMKKLDQDKLQLLDSIQKQNAYLGQVVALNTYLFYPANPEGYTNEIGYFAEKFFRFVDWSDSNLDYNPWVYESWKSYTETLSRIGLPADQHKAYIEASLATIPTDKRAYQLALSGAIASLQQTQHPNFGHFANLFIEKYKTQLPEVCASLEKKIQLMTALSVGGEAPDFEMANPDGTLMNLHSMRGKVVLVDFWASWCGPCRRENPNVVRVYEKYKDKGFEVLGVSLDRERARWINAIEADGLVWQHVSDLKGWQNEAAQLYEVRSIPATLLLDAEGRILARNLRGPALESKLAEIFGE